ncbi:MAG: pyridoxamine 5'-phosphate oxidase family protein [Clostridia bacterium]|nr:pyridoxamine 5'-phosphate oxidase family protein [Clostridia bacterium]
MEFRELIRIQKKLERQACVELLRRETRGVLSVCGDGGYPYGMPMNHFYCEADGCLYFHCGREGHRIDALRRCDKVSFCVYEEGRPIEGHWALTVRSVIVFGRMEIIDDPERVAQIATALSRKFTSDEQYIQREIELYGKDTLLLKLTPEHLCGKQVTEA